MTKIIKLKTGTKLEETSSYSRLVCVDDWIFTSNTAGRNPETGEISDDLREHTLQVFANVERSLEAVGSSLADVVSARVYITNPEDTPFVMGIFGEKFRGIDPAVTVTSPPLASAIYLVEMEVTAYKGAAEHSEILQLKG